MNAELHRYSPYFTITYAKVNVMLTDGRADYSEAVLKVEVDGQVEHTASDGNGPVNALDNALRKALVRFYPEVANMQLVDYKVRVLVESSDGERTWGTVGVSHNIIQASLQALSDSLNYKIFHNRSKEVTGVMS